MVDVMDWAGGSQRPQNISYQFLWFIVNLTTDYAEVQS